jgi:GxxExxY protein
MELKYNMGNNSFSAGESPAYYGSNSRVNSITYELIGACMEVHSQLGKGYSEVVYKDAISYELQKRALQFSREKKYEIRYKDIILDHYYFADFVVEDKIILEIKAQRGALENHYQQTINYLAVSGCEIGLIINFAENSLQYKRVIHTKDN